MMLYEPYVISAIQLVRLTDIATSLGCQAREKQRTEGWDSAKQLRSDSDKLISLAGAIMGATTIERATAQSIIRDIFVEHNPDLCLERMERVDQAAEPDTGVREFHGTECVNGHQRRDEERDEIEPYDRMRDDEMTQDEADRACNRVGASGVPGDEG